MSNDDFLSEHWRGEAINNPQQETPMDDETKRSYEWKSSLGAKAHAAAEKIAGDIVALKGVRFSSEAREIMGHKLALLWLDGMQHGQTIAFEAAKDLLSRPVETHVTGAPLTPP